MGEDLQADQRIHGRLALARLEVGRRAFGVVGLDEQAAARRLLGLLSEFVEYRPAGIEESTADALAVAILADDQVLGEAAVGRRHVAEDGAAEHQAALLGHDDAELPIRRCLGEKRLDAVQFEDGIGVSKRGLQQAGQRPRADGLRDRGRGGP